MSIFIIGMKKIKTIKLKKFVEIKITLNQVIV